MKTEDVSKLSPENRFWYWCKERYSIRKKRLAGRSKPWTDDVVLRENFFTNPYREHDKVTVWFRDRVRDILRDDARVLLATIIFRWFNLPATGKILIKDGLGKFGYLENWNKRDVIDRLSKERDRKHSVFTGAFMINSPPGMPKLEAIAQRIENVWKDRSPLYKSIRSCDTLEEAHQRLLAYEGLGGFMAYEVVCDLRYTHLLEDAKDKLIWCNPGPGCIRGLYRISGKEIENKSNSTSPPRLGNELETMRELLEKSRSKLLGMPRFEMREIEHSLCEYDKMERVRLGEGRSKRKYKGT